MKLQFLELSVPADNMLALKHWNNPTTEVEAIRDKPKVQCKQMWKKSHGLLEQLIGVYVNYYDQVSGAQVA